MRKVFYSFLKTQAYLNFHGIIYLFHLVKYNWKVKNIFSQRSSCDIPRTTDNHIYFKIMKIIAKPVIERLFTLNSPSNIRKWAHNIPLLQLLYFPLTLKIKGEHLNVECNPLVFEYCSFQWLFLWRIHFDVWQN